MKTNPLRERRVKAVLSGRRKQVRDKNKEILLKYSRISELEGLLKVLDRELSGLRGSIKQAWDNGVISRDVV